ncbi:hypothetical protein [Nocardioides sp.]|uniref:hypothetical protein n=1 Tax=Nocardioides sp. TaxID=35761 RepID=UPI003561B1FB
MTTNTAKQSIGDAIADLTGHHEEAIARRFKAPIEDLDGAKFVRAALFGRFLSEGGTEDDAYSRVMNMRQREVTDAFAPEREELADEPVSDEGKFSTLDD